MFGERKCKALGFRMVFLLDSSSQPLFLLRRFMEWSRMTDHNSQLLFLDWKPAFDSVDHQRMLQALKRFGVSANAEAAVSSLHSKPVFVAQGFDMPTIQGTGY